MFLSSAGFPLLHALATPQILLTGRNAGFAIATPVGLLPAAVFAALSSLTSPPNGPTPCQPPGAAQAASVADGRLGGGVAARAAAAGRPLPEEGAGVC